MVVSRFFEDELGKLKNPVSSSARKPNSGVREGPEAAGEEGDGLDRIGFFFFSQQKKVLRQTG